MRAERKTRRNIASKLKPSETTAVRLGALETRVERLETGLAELREARARDDPYGAAALFADRPQPAKRQGGRPRAMDDATLCGERDRLIDRLEAYWPQLESRLLAATSAEGIRMILEPYSTEDWAKHLTAHADSLADFLKPGGRWFMPPKARLVRAFGSWATPKQEAAAKKAAMCLPPRQIACAMAGVPKLSWRTSFDRCQRRPCQMASSSGVEEFYRLKYKLPWPREIWDRARQGDSYAQYNVGLAYQHGIGAECDLGKAAEWFERAAMQGDGHAQTALADIYRTGHGVPQSNALAFLWARVVPFYPAMEPWLAEIAASVATDKERERVTALARELMALIRQFQDGRGIRLTVPPVCDVEPILEKMASVIQHAIGSSL